MAQSRKPLGMRTFLLDNTDQLRKIRYRLKSYLPIFLKAMIRGVSVKGLLYTRMPFKFKTPNKPPSISIELTDACDLKCLYCNNPLFSNPRTFMSDTVMAEILRHLTDLGKVDRTITVWVLPTAGILAQKFNPRLNDFSRAGKNEC